MDPDINPALTATQLPLTNDNERVTFFHHAHSPISFSSPCQELVLNNRRWQHVMNINQNKHKAGPIFSLKWISYFLLEYSCWYFTEQRLNDYRINCNGVTKISLIAKIWAWMNSDCPQSKFDCRYVPQTGLWTLLPSGYQEHEMRGVRAPADQRLHGAQWSMHLPKLWAGKAALLLPIRGLGSTSSSEVPTCSWLAMGCVGTVHTQKQSWFLASHKHWPTVIWSLTLSISSQNKKFIMSCALDTVCIHKRADSNFFVFFWPCSYFRLTFFFLHIHTLNIWTYTFNLKF